MRKIITLGIMLLFLGMTISSSTGLYLENQSTVATFDGNTLYVGGSGPGNYTTIQAAIDDASDGDTVFVYDDSSPYRYGRVVVNKSINLIGEDRDTTVIESDYVVTVYSDNVNISGFTIKGKVGIKLQESSNCIISSNIISNNNYYNCWPIELQEAHHTIISGNNISNNGGIEYGAICSVGSNHIILSGNNILNNDYAAGICLISSLNDTIIGNNISNNYWGIYYHNPPIGIFIYSLRSIISDNIICSNDGCGIAITGIGNANCVISGNDISNNRCGISCDGLRRNKITDNIISNNKEGIFLMSSGNIIEGNNIANNQLGINIYSVYNRVFRFRLNIVKENNFIENERSVSYDFFTNRWIRNYWDDWGSPSPRPIKGDCTFWGLSIILLEIILDKDIDIIIPWVQYDWHPAQEPYDIGV